MSDLPAVDPADPTVSSDGQAREPDYTELVRFLMQPFLESLESLRLDCERSPRTGRILIRLAIEGEDKGRVFGRGGRNIHAVRTVLQSIAKANNRAVYLEVFGSESVERSREGDHPHSSGNRRPPTRRSSRPRTR